MGVGASRPLFRRSCLRGGSYSPNKAIPTDLASLVNVTVRGATGSNRVWIVSIGSAQATIHQPTDRRSMPVSSMWEGDDPAPVMNLRALLVDVATH